MSNVAISHIDLDVAGKLHVHPRPINVGYTFIWRDASSVRWDESERILYVLSIRDFNVIDELRQILNAVKREYGDTLFCDKFTTFNVPAELESELRQIARQSNAG